MLLKLLKLSVLTFMVHFRIRLCSAANHRGTEMVSVAPGLGRCIKTVLNPESCGKSRQRSGCSGRSVTGLSTDRQHQLILQFQFAIQHFAALKFVPYGIYGNGRNATGSRGLSAAAADRRGTRCFNAPTGFNYQSAGCDQTGEFGVAEFGQQSPDVAVDRLFPHIFPLLEIPADDGGLDATIDCRCIQCKQAAFTHTDHTDREWAPSGCGALLF